MNELSQMVDVNQVINDIKKEFQKPRPNTRGILKSLIDLRTNKKIQQPSDSKFFDIVGETFKLDPDFFMKELYKTFMVKLGNIIGAEKRKEMEKYIIEKFCLAEDEHILYECKGNVKQIELIEQKASGKYKMDTFPLTISVSSGDVFLTNYRLIAHGLLKAKGGESTTWWIWTSTLWVFTGGSKRTERKKELIESSPLFGYQFPIKNHWGLSKSKLLHLIGYNVNMDKMKCNISIKPTDKSKREEHMSKIFDFLRKDVNEVLDVINEVMEIEQSEKWRRRYISNILKSLRKTEEYTDLSDSEFFDIVGKTFKLDPDFFMTSVYPKMMSWNFPSFLSVKEEVITLIDKLNNELELCKPEQADDFIKFVKE
ncbi:MAG: hypothetical protein ACFFDN_39055 [Candidatus Hodarchaeota archaeon]